MIRITQSKTSGLLELPLPEDVGWAVIDYLRNGRPQTGEHILFVRVPGLPLESRYCPRQERSEDP